jgi:hypothetical protein
MNLDFIADSHYKENNKLNSQIIFVYVFEARDNVVG